jgi:hypothetical protein
MERSRINSIESLEQGDHHLKTEQRLVEFDLTCFDNYASMNKIDSHF